MKNIFLSLISGVLFTNLIFGQSPAQVTNNIRVDSMNTAVHFCGAGPDYTSFINNAYLAVTTNQSRVPTFTPGYSPQSIFFPGQIEHCGPFNIYYQDYIAGLNEGFADPTVGAQRRATFCAVLQYIDSVINIPAGVTLDIFVAQSFSATNHYMGTGGTLAFASPNYPANFASTTGIHNGYLYDHITTGLDPDTNQYDMTLTVNFDRIFDALSNQYVNIGYHNDYTAFTQTCVYDLYTVLLHEVTHGMGFLSFVIEDATTHQAKNGNNQTLYNNSFTLFDKLFLYKGSIQTTSFTKVVDASNVSSPFIDPTINTFTDPLRSNDIWISNTANPLNHPIYSGNYLLTLLFNGEQVVPGSFMSHLNHAPGSFLGMSQYSPGFREHYVMGATIDEEEFKRRWTLEEMRILLSMGYSLNPAFAAANSLNGTDLNSQLLNNNSPAYRTNTSTPISSSTNEPMNLVEIPTFDFTLQNNNSPITPTVSTLTINISSLPNISDLNGNSISIMPGSLFGLRGVSSGGDNHNLLAVNSGGTQIVYTPVPTFKGVAQFAFNLWDGHEKGALKIISIDVTAGTYTPAIGQELVINGGFEDATEVKQRFTNTTLPYSSYESGIEGDYFNGTHFAGGHPYSFLTNNWSPYGAGIARLNSYHHCNAGSSPAVRPIFGWESNSSNNTSAAPFNIPLPLNTTPGNECFVRFQGANQWEYFRMADNFITNKYYKVEFDVALGSGGNSNTSPNQSIAVSLIPTSSPYPNPFSVTQYQNENITTTIPLVNTTDTSMYWKHVKYFFMYCGSPTEYFALSSSKGLTFIDNVSIIQDTTFHAFDSLTVKASKNPLCAGDSSLLTAHPYPTVCNVNYTWLPGGFTNDSIWVHPNTTTTYTVIATNGTDSITETITITVSGVLPVVTVTPNNPVVCPGAFVTFTAGGATTYQWSPGNSTVNPLTVAAANSMIYTVTGTIGTCTSSATAILNVLPTPTVTINATSNPACIGVNDTLTATGANTYSWSPAVTCSGNCSTTVISTTTTVSYTVTGTDANGCVGTGTITLNVAPTPTITVSASAATICQGKSDTLTASGGNTYSWSPVVSCTGNCSTAVASPTVTTTYTVTGTSSTGCTATNTITVNVNPSPIIIVTATDTNKMCPGHPDTLFASGANTYSWSPSAGLNQTTGSTVISTATATTTYTVTGTDVNGCTGTAIQSVAIKPATFTVSISSPGGFNKFCPGDSAQLTAATNALSPTYQWYNSSGIISGATLSTLYVSTANSYYCIVTDVNGCTKQSNTLVMTAAIAPAITITIPTDTFCEHIPSIPANIITIHPSPPGGSTIQYYQNGNPIPPPGFLLVPSQSGSYYVTVTYANGCVQTSDTLNILIYPKPDISLTPNGSISLCGSNTVLLTASTTFSPVTYNWLFNNSPAGTTNSITVSTAGTAIITVTETTHGCANKDTTPVYQAPQYVCDRCFVPNGDFEYYAGIASSLSDILLAPFWNSAGSAPNNGSPDFFNSAFPNSSGVSVPNNTFNNNVPANSGGGYVGFYTYSPSANYREYIQSPLKCTLEQNQQYKLTFFLRDANKCQYTSNNIGVYLSATAPVQSASLPLFNSAGIVPQFNVATVHASNSSWGSTVPNVPYTFQFAGNGEAYVTVGNFYDDNATLHPQTYPGNQLASSYYLIDDINVVALPPAVTATPSGCVASGTAITFNMTGSPSYTINDGVSTFTVNTTAGSFTVNPATTTSYTISTNLSCDLCNVDTVITVHVKPNTTVTSPSICKGATATIIASGAATYSWTAGTTPANTATVTATPTVTTSYTVTGADAFGCSSTAITTVTVNGLPNVTVTSPSICKGATATVIASGASTYSWTAGTTPANTATVTATPTVTTTYTVTGTDANGCTKTATSTVTVNPLPNVTVNSPTICAGAIVSLIAAPTTLAYTWSPGTSPSTGFAVHPSPSPTVTTSYTVTGTNTVTGCSNTAVSTVHVNPAPAISVSLSSGTPQCAGIPVIATASGANSYAWGSNPPGAVQASAFPSVTATLTPYPGTTFSVTGTNGAGCTSTIAVTPPVLSITCSGGNVPANLSITTNTMIPSSPVNIPANQTLTIVAGSTITVTNKEFRMGSSSVIHIQNGAVLNINGCWLHSCGCMWVGIEVENGGALNMANSPGILGSATVIEDAFIAVNNLPNPNTNGSIPKINISNTLFNKNRVGIFQQENQNNVTASYVRNSIFTCRNMGTSATPPFLSNLGFVLDKNQFVNNFNTISTNFPQTNTALGTRSQMGVRVNSVRHANGFKIGNPAQTNYVNVFDNLDYGCVVTGSNCLIKNNQFQNLTGNNNGTGFQTNATGVGILAVNDKANFTLVAGEYAALGDSVGTKPVNIFRNNLRGCDITNYIFYAFNNDLDNQTTNHYNSIPNQGVAFSGNGQYTGEYGFFFKNTQPFAVTCVIEANNIMDCNIGVHVNRNFNYDANLISVNCNNISSNQINFTGTQPQYCYKGIIFEDIIGNLNSNVPTFGIRARYNTVTSAIANAIYCSNIKKGLDIRANGELSVLYHPTNKVDVLRLNSCENSNIENNGQVATSLGNTTTGNIDISGIYIFGSKGTTLKCNLSRYVGQCIAFDGDCSNSHIENNTMRNGRVGLFMLNDAIIGTQGAIGSPEGNKWGTASFVVSQTFTKNMPFQNVNLTSIIYGKNVTLLGNTQYPLVHSSAGAAAYALTVGMIATTGTGPNCVSSGTYAQNCPTAGGGGGGMFMLVNSNIPPQALLRQTISSGVSPFFGAEQKWNAQNWTFNTLTADPTLLTGDTMLTNFFNSNLNTVHNQFLQVNQKQLSSQFVQARTDNSSIITSNTIEQNKQNLNEVLLKKLSDTTYIYTPADSQMILSIASQCPYSGGDVVFAAQAWYNQKTNRLNYFPDACTISGNRVAENPTIHNPLYGQVYFNLYPNPNDGSFTVEYDLGERESVIFEVCDLSGKKVFSKRITNEDLIMKMNLDELSNGLYFYKVIDRNILLNSGKIGIQK